MNTSKKPTKVLVVDDHSLVRRALRSLIASEPDMECVAQAASKREALDYAAVLNPDVAVIDLSLPDGCGIGLVEAFSAATPRIQSLILTSAATEAQVSEAVAAGASGFVFKDILEQDLVRAIRRLSQGGSLLDPSATDAIFRMIRQSADYDPLDSLSEQDRKLVELIGEGLTNREIAERMYLSEKTVKNYVSSLLTKLGLARRTQIATLSVRSHTSREIRV